MKACKRKGFTLIEVCLVMLIFGVAVSSLMALFPVSLRQGTLAVSDSVVSSFGDSVMNSLAGVASSMQSKNDWLKWVTEDAFKNAIKSKGIKVDTSGTNLKGDKPLQVGVEDTVEDYLGLAPDKNSKKGRVDIRYRLEIAKVNKPEEYDGRLYRASLHVTDNPSLDLDNGTVFVTYLAYTGQRPEPVGEEEP